MVTRNLRPSSKAPLSDATIIAVARLVDDSHSTRETSHSAIQYEIERAGLEAGDPVTHGQVLGKFKRVRGVLNWALEYDFEAGEKLVNNLISLLKGCGGLRESSPNYVGSHAIQDAASTFRSEGYVLTEDGEISPLLLDNITGAELTSALESYVRRARRGSADAALVVGTSKDLLEATAAHVLQELWGSYPNTVNFPTLLGQAFTALGFKTPQDSAEPGEPMQKQLEREMYNLACVINRLRNKEGTGRGRPWLSSVDDDVAKSAVEFMAIISDRLLTALKATKN